MMQAYEIPLSPAPQRLSISLGGVQYRLQVRWNRVLGAWVLDIADADAVDILTGVPIVTAVGLLDQYEHLGFGGQLIALTDSAADTAPGYTTLGVTGHLYWITA